MKRLGLALALVAVSGTAVVFAAPAAGDAFRSAEPTPTMTADERSAYSEQREREGQAERQRILQEYIDSGESVAHLRKAESTGIRLDQPLRLDDTLNVSDHLLSGVIEDQFLKRLPNRDELVFIVSVFVDDEGVEVGRLVQPTGLSRSAQGQALLFGYGSEGLNAGEQYAAPCIGPVDDCLAQYGHLYAVDEAGLVQPFSSFEGDDTIRGRPIEDLVAMWKASRPD